jgi:transposase
MIDRRIIFEIYRMADEGFSKRKIAEKLKLNRDTVSKYLHDPNAPKPVIVRQSKLDPFKEIIRDFLSQDPEVSAVVIRDRLRAQEFDGGLTILRDYLRKLRAKPKQVFIRFESNPGEQFQIDWGHFGSIIYGNHARKLYCMAVVECHSRMLYLEFTHSQRQETLHRTLLNAFYFFGGTPRELVFDNMASAVIEREGPLVRFNEAFLEFLRPLRIVPRPCNVKSPHEKGKVEKGAIHYIRHNFFPLRKFADLDDLKSQAQQWRDEVANVRLHATTGERPVDRFNKEALRPLPEMLPDCRDQAPAKVQSDFAVSFDGNFYTVPPWVVGKQVMVKADNRDLSIYFREKAIATHKRSWQHRTRIEAPQHREAAPKHSNRKFFCDEVASLMALGEVPKSFLENLAASGQPIRKSARKLLELHDEYGSYALFEAIKKASMHNAFGVHYIENILYQEMTPQRQHPPVQLKQQHLNTIRLEEPCLEDFDAFVIKRKQP